MSSHQSSQVISFDLNFLLSNQVKDYDSQKHIYSAMMKLNSHGARRAKIHIVKIYCMVLERWGREGGRL